MQFLLFHKEQTDELNQLALIRMDGFAENYQVKWQKISSGPWYALPHIGCSGISLKQKLLGQKIVSVLWQCPLSRDYS